jgi:hypothetical protein
VLFDLGSPVVLSVDRLGRWLLERSESVHTCTRAYPLYEASTSLGSGPSRSVLTT